MGYIKRLVPALEIVVVGIYQQLPLLRFMHSQHSATSISIFSSQKNAWGELGWRWKQKSVRKPTIEVPKMPIHSKGGVYLSAQTNWRKNCVNGDENISRQECVHHEIYDKK